ncbi:hypothetical protein ACGF8B_40055 [Streptomyces sp. NPDC047917]|uniref:hypothetical protein n=1 Tax=Streptomyces sp. NPDC047917 TaxID=3365491 RepID=UPI00371B6528
MSVNYYAFGPFVGGRPDGEGLHIGQSVAAQRFLFRAHSDQGLTTLGDWLAFIDRPGVTIRNEYGRKVTAREMQETMTASTDRQGAPLRPRFLHGSEDRYLTSGGHAFCRHEFF